MRRKHARRVLRILSSCLILVGGIVLAYPLWSSGYAQVAQKRLGTDLRQNERSFDRVMGNDQALARLREPARRLAALADLYGRQTRVGTSLGRLRIPKLGLDVVVLEGVHRPPGPGRGNDQGLLRNGPVHYGLTPLPGAGRPFAVAGHRTTYGAPFYALDRLRRGDAILLTLPYARLTYEVARTTIVAPSDVSVLADQGYDLVLTTCHPRYSAARRLIVWARLAGFNFR